MSTTKKKKGKTISLTDFLGSDSKLVTVRTSNWSEIVDNEEEAEKPIVVDLGALPTAPRAAHDIDLASIPNTPPFVAHVANLSFEITDEDLRRIFADLNPKAARIMRDGMRSKGVGLVEFESRENLIEALKRSEKELYGRRIRISVSDKTDIHGDSGRGNAGGHRSHRGGEERPELANTWKRAEPRSDDSHNDQSSGGFHRGDRQHRNDYGRQNAPSGQRDNQHGNDFGFGYPRQRDDRGTGNTREYNRPGQRNRYQDDSNRPGSGTDRPRYSGRYSDTRDMRDRNRADDETREEQREPQKEPPRERQRLQLQPRTKPLEENQPMSAVDDAVTDAAHSSMSHPDDLSVENASTNETSSDHQQDTTDSASRVNTTDEQPTAKPSRGAGASIFGGAKPVDTLARELEIEKKMKELQMTGEKSEDTEEKPASSSRPYNRGDRDGFRNKRQTHNDDPRDRKDNPRSGHGPDYHHKREYSGGRKYEEDTRKRDDDQSHRGGGGYDRDRYGGPSRRDHDSGRTGKYNHHNQSDRNTDRGNNRNRDRDNDNNEFNNVVRPSNNNFTADSQPRTQQRGKGRGTMQTEDDSHKLQLSNKFGMLDDEELDDHNENDEDAQNQSIDE